MFILHIDLLFLLERNHCALYFLLKNEVKNVKIVMVEKYRRQSCRLLT